MSKRATRASSTKKAKLSKDGSFRLEGGVGSDGGQEHDDDHQIEQPQPAPFANNNNNNAVVNASPAPKRSKGDAKPAKAAKAAKVAKAGPVKQAEPILPHTNVDRAIEDLEAGIQKEERATPHNWTASEAALLRVLVNGCKPTGGLNYNALMNSFNKELRTMCVEMKIPFVPFTRAQVKSKCETLKLNALRVVPTDEPPKPFPHKPAPVFDNTHSLDPEIPLSTPSIVPWQNLLEAPYLVDTNTRYILLLWPVVTGRTVLLKPVGTFIQARIIKEDLRFDSLGPLVAANLKKEVLVDPTTGKASHKKSLRISSIKTPAEEVFRYPFPAGILEKGYHTPIVDKALRYFGMRMEKEYVQKEHRVQVSSADLEDEYIAKLVEDEMLKIHEEELQKKAKKQMIARLKAELGSDSSSSDDLQLSRSVEPPAKERKRRRSDVEDEDGFVVDGQYGGDSASVSTDGYDDDDENAS